MSAGETLIWKPNVTVAAVVECDGRFLLIEEHTERHRFPLVVRCVEDYLAGRCYPPSLLVHHSG